ncbi:MAG: tRNA (adenosine(37)-N6)-dimethylallyltransferase MiaA [Peptoniphilus sp.]|nr:tRNA (adenosine(37)-N6)-dimethylallyltransferase MiaA [Peptoniphilus sp.]
MDNLLIITGPTGVGKSELSLEIAKKYNGEIISADSMQIYRGMDIGTAKIDTDKTDIKHHLIDIVNPDENYSVAEFQKSAKNLIKKINESGKLPIIVGGTGLYINSIVYELDFQNVEMDFEYRKFLNDQYNEKGLDYLYERLKELDPDSALNIDRQNKNRVIRALEISRYSKRKTSDLRKKNEDYNLLYIGLYMDRKLLYDKIDKRVDDMIEKGLLKETKSIVKENFDLDYNSLKAIGYKEIIAYLKGEYDFEEAIRLIKRNSRRYAKRQITWFKKDDRINWIDKNSDDFKEKIHELIGAKFGKF